MPFTLAHPAAAIPLCGPMRRFGVLSALVIGSMTPDLVYFAPMGISRVQSHSLLGLFWFCIPFGVAAYVLFHLLLAPVLVHVLPTAIGGRLPPALMTGTIPAESRAGIVLSIIVGAGTHLIWDSATHDSGLLVGVFPALSATLFEVGGYRVFVYKLLQHGSTFLGGGAILFWICRWFLSTTPGAEPPPRKSRRAVWLSRFVLFAVPLLVGAVSALGEFGTGGWLDSLRAPVGQFIFAGGSAFVVIWLVLGLMYRGRRQSAVSASRVRGP